MNRRLSCDMQITIVKKDAKENRLDPIEAIKSIMEDPALVSDPELLDYSNSKIADLSED